MQVMPITLRCFAANAIESFQFSFYGELEIRRPMDLVSHVVYELGCFFRAARLTNV